MKRRKRRAPGPPVRPATTSQYFEPITALTTLQANCYQPQVRILGSSPSCRAPDSEASVSRDQSFGFGALGWGLILVLGGILSATAFYSMCTGFQPHDDFGYIMLT